MVVYEKGFELVTEITACIVAAYALLALAWSIYVSPTIAKHKMVKKTIVIHVMVAAVLYLVLFPAVYSLVSVFFNNFASIDFWRADISNGSFAVRVCSFIITYKLVASAIRLYKYKKFLLGMRRKRGLNFSDAGDFRMNLTNREAKIWVASDLALVDVLQYGFYLCAIGSIWLSNISGSHSIWTAMASWCLFFIVDDWSVMSEYSQHFRRFPLRFHMRKILAFNVILVLIVPTSIFAEDVNYIGVLLTLAMVLSAVMVPLLNWKSTLLAGGVERPESSMG